MAPRLSHHIVDKLLTLIQNSENIDVTLSMSKFVEVILFNSASVLDLAIFACFLNQDSSYVDHEAGLNLSIHSIPPNPRCRTHLL